MNPVATEVRRIAPWTAVVLGLLCTAFPVSAQNNTSGGLRVEELASGLEHPWALAFIDKERMLVSERPGRLRLLRLGEKPGASIEGLPEIDSGGQGGLLDVVTDSGFARNRTIYFCYSEPGKGGNSTAMASARLSDDSRRLEQLKVLFSQRPKYPSNAHFGCRIVEARDGTLFLTLGDRFQRMQDAQTLDNHHGKVVRVRKDGSVPPDNPFADKSKAPAGALPEIWSYGHRNVQGATLGPDGGLWISEHGAQGGDEINRPQAGKNYGWPVISYGVHYGGAPVGDGATAKPGMEQPVYYWTPSMAPAGMTFLRSDRYGKAWQGNLFVGALKFRYLARLEIQDGRVVREEKLLQDLDQRIRDVREGPDGLLYVLTDHRNGKLLRLLPGS